jgi:hypothetical protein
MEQGNPNSLHLMEGCKRFHLPASGEGQCKKRMPMCNAFDRVEEILEHFRCGRGCAWLAGLGYPPPPASHRHRTGHGGSTRVFGRLIALVLYNWFSIPFSIYIFIYFLFLFFLVYIARFLYIYIFFVIFFVLVFSTLFYRYILFVLFLFFIGLFALFFIYILFFCFLFINKNKKRIYIKNVRKKQRKYIYISI